MPYVLQRLLRADDPPPVAIVNGGAATPLVLTGDHAGRAIPAALGDLGVAAADRARHIGWDIGVEALGQALATQLDAVFVHQRYSRLVIDCNRDPASPAAVPEASDGTLVPGNRGLSADARAARVAEIHAPYQAAVAAALAARPAAVLVALHSFTPVMDGVARPWALGVLHDGHTDGFATALLAWLQRHSGMIAGDNEPYRMDTTDYSVPFHAFASGRRYVEIEVRQDLLGDAAGVAAMATLLAAGISAVADA